MDLFSQKTKWITTSLATGDAVPEFFKEWHSGKTAAQAELLITALGVYEARLNGLRVGDFVLAPGWTTYEKRLQVQRYDVTALLGTENCLTVRVGKGWYASPMPGWVDDASIDGAGKRRRAARQTALIAELRIRYTDGSTTVIATDPSWRWRESPVRFSEIYDGERYDACFAAPEECPCAEYPGPFDTLIPQEGEEIHEIERVAARSVFRTPAGELLVDFGQEVTGYVEFIVEAQAGDRVRILHGEVLDRDGNFYNANYRSAKAEIEYICRAGKQTWHPGLTFFGFRYLKLAEFPGTPTPEQFTAVVVCSALRQTGSIRSGHDGLNQLISNVFWGQKGNFLDVPTDCPQRDERLGWTGDAQAFVKAASLNYDVECFFSKWLADLAAGQRPDGGVGSVIPDILPGDKPSAAWGDAAVICPWQIYQTYGDPAILRRQFESMKKWVDYITGATTEKNLWTGGTHFGDWLGLDAPSGSYKGSSREDFIASAFYAHATDLVVKAGQVLGEDAAEYRRLHKDITAAFRARFPVYGTQTEHVLAVHFGLCPEPQKTADALAELIRRDGVQMRTGFVGTPYLLHVLSDYGYSELAWSLLLREKYPSWLYAVKQGATTVWEHWDGIMEDGSFWSADMNSFNHYAYGSVIDWLYEKAAGIRHEEDAAGFSRAVIAPLPDPRIGWLDVNLETRHGKVRSAWRYTAAGVRYEIEADMPVELRLSGRTLELAPGRYTFWGEG